MTREPQVAEQLFTGQSEMAIRMRALDWSQTSLGAIETWPQSLCSALSICLNSRFPIAIYWGADSLLLYNDAWRPIVGDKHPWSLGRSGREVWSEIWDEIGPELASVLATGQGTFHHDEMLAMHRFGYTEECFFEYTFNPIQGQGGVVDGVFNIVTETTYRVLNDRRAQLLREIASQTGTAKTAEAACELAIAALQSDPSDIPVALLYLIDAEGSTAHLCRCTPCLSSPLVCPATVELAKPTEDPWKIAVVTQTGEPQIIHDLVSEVGSLPGGIWSEPPQEAMVLPIVATGQSRITGVLVAVASPRRRLDANYREFFVQVAGQVALAIANARAYEEERKRAEALADIDRAKTVFFSNVSHEFRTPLTLMLAPLEDAIARLKDCIPEQEREQLQMVRRNGLRLLKLVNTLLDFSRIEAGRVQASYDPTDLASLTAELASVFRSTLERANLRLVVDCPALPEPVYVDREMWEKIVFNLLSNAFKFTFTGEIVVRLRWQGDRVEFTVQDTGIGIPATELPHLFERFHRVKGAQGRSFEGSGIGLSLVQELVKLHHGTIAVTSVEGVGTCFTLAIPTGTAHLPQDRIGSTRTLTSTALGATPYLEEALRWLGEPTDNGKLDGNFADDPLQTAPKLDGSLPPDAAGGRILLAEDNADMRDYVRRLLSQQYQVEAVADGHLALSAVQRQMPDLVLTDVMMPHLDGFGLLQALRSNPQTQDVPIILLSARAGEEARIEGLAAGADDYVTKPFSARELLVRVEATLKLSQLRREATQREQMLRLEAETVQQQLERILSSINDGFYVLDNDWRFIYVNDRYCEMVGMSREALLGQNVWALFPASLNTEADDKFHQAMREQTPLQFDYLYQPWNCWHDHRVYPSPNGLTVFLADISDRKQAEAALRESESRFRLMTDAAPMLVWMAGTDKLCNYFNQSWLSFTGRTLEQEWGNGWTEGVHPEDFQRCVDTYIAAFDARRSFEMDYRLKRFDGEYRWILDAGSPRFTSEGEFLGYIGSCFDIHERKQLEAEQQRILQLEQTAREKAEQANRIKDEFLAVLSHELRSPLNPILGWTKLLQKGNLGTARTTQALATIERNAKLQAELIEDLLDVSRILQGKLNLHASWINLASTIQAAVETVRLAAEAKSIHIETSLDPQVGQIWGDSTRLQQVVWNLLSNAVKFTTAGGRVTVQLKQVHDQAQITVTDTGKGIAPDFLPYVFDYFRQADSATTRKFGGLGLGLAIVRHLVELHGGTVHAESLGEDQGATFIIYLPRSNRSEAAFEGGPGSAAPALNEQRLSGLRVLVVDDEADMRDLIVFSLEQMGATVLTVSTAWEVLAALPHFQPDVLLSDIGMPEMDGYMLMQQIRVLPREQGGQVKAIALTAYAGELNQRQAIQAGFQRHISKPVEPEVLVNEIIHLMSLPSPVNL